MRANLQGAYLDHANLNEAQLPRANLRGCRLIHADLSGAQLHEADLRETNVFKANFSDAQLLNTNLSGVKVDAAVGLTQDQLRLAIGVPEDVLDRLPDV